MINELYEYEIYQSIYHDKEIEAYPFINKRALENGVSALSRPLEIIARHSLFHEDPEDFDRAKKEAHEWLVYLYKSKTLADLYQDKKKTAEENKQNYDKTYKAISSFNRRCQGDIFSNSEYDSTDYNKITYDRIVARAYDKGPLRKQCLIAKKDMFMGKEVFAYFLKSDAIKVVSAGEKDYLLKLTATFLQNVLSGHDSVRVIDVDVLTWATSQTKKTSYYKFLPEGSSEQILIFETIEVSNGNNLNKIRFNKNWIDNFKLVDITEDGAWESWLKTDEAKEYRIRYLDQGIHKALIEEGIEA